ncbi:iron-containing alcohol dehydrogenase, partial [Chloroflexota bacterium]
MDSIFQFQIPQSIIGIKSLDRLGDLVKDLGAKKPLIVTDKGIIKAGLISLVEAILGEINCDYDIFDECQPNAPVSIAEACSQRVIANNHDILIGIGGGSTMDTTKVVSVVAPNRIAVVSLIGQRDLKMKSLPKVLIPTTSGTGSEWSRVAMITDDRTGVKSLFGGAALTANAVIIDPELTLNLPRNITAETGMDALTHAIEAYISIRHNIITDMFAEKAIKIIAHNLERVYVDGADLEARYKMSIAASLAITAFGAAGGGLAHSIDPLITARTHISHGAALSILLPPLMTFRLSSIPDRLAKIAELMGEIVENLPLDQAAMKAVEAVKRLVNKLNIKPTLGSVGIKPDEIQSLAEKIIKKVRTPNTTEQN